MKKVVLLVRVSSIRQDYEAQLIELREFVRKDGYSDGEMEVIEDKESGSKLSDEERNGLTKMYAAIENPDNEIEAVYCWELSRLSRKPATVWNIKEYLAEKKINLIVKQQNLNMLREAGNFTMIFSIYVGMCESEIQLKTERTERGKRLRAAQGCYIGGTVRYGYTYDKNNPKKEYVVDPQQADVVRTIFELYSTGKYGAIKIHDELLKIGENMGIGVIKQILTNKEYTGEEIEECEYAAKVRGKEQKKRRYRRSYPQIISKETYDKCRQVAKKNNNNIDKSKNIYYANKLIKCSGCGSSLTASKKQVVYLCNNKYNRQTKIECSGGDSININVIDSLLWHLAKEEEVFFLLNLSEKNIVEWKNEIDRLQNEIDNSDKQYNAVVAKKKTDISKVMRSLGEKELEAFAVAETKDERQRIKQDKIHCAEER